jgi:hypothetical protein
MPSKTAKQARTMAAAAHNPDFAKKVGIPTSVAKEFNEADKGRKFGTGGNVNYTYGGKGQINKQRTRGGSIYGVQKNLPNANLNKYVGKKEGGEVKHEDIKMDKKVAKKAIAMHDKQLHGGKKTDLTALKKGGMTAGKAAHAVKEGKRVAKEMEYDYKTGKKSFAGSTAKKDAHAEKEGRKVAKALEYDYSKGRKMASGGLAAGHKSADGCATKGKTKARAVTMKKGGKC